LGLSVNRVDGEWRVALPGKGQEDGAYYTHDSADAYHTAHRMAADWRASPQNKGGIA
jgi:hypothetical protein